MHHTGPFGDVPSERIAAVTIESVSALRQEILRRSESAADAGQWQQLSGDEEFLKKVDSFRVELGALWLQLWKRLDEDIEVAHCVSGNFWNCMWVALIRRRLRPQKYYAICGTPTAGYGSLVTYLANVPGQDQLIQRWRRNTWKEYVDSIWTTKNQLMDKEKEYRGAAVAIAQIGIGVGGMLIGLIGLALSFIIPLLMALF